MFRIAALVAAGALATLTSACTAGSPTHAHAGTTRPPPAPAATRARGHGSDSVTALLKRPLRLRLLRPGQPCPASHGTPVSTADFGGIALGRGPVRPIIAQQPPSVARRGIAYLAPSSAPPWLAIKTLWFSVPAYQGPFVIRARRLDRPGLVGLGGQPATAPITVPSGPTPSTGLTNWRTVPAGHG